MAQAFEKIGNMVRGEFETGAKTFEGNNLILYAQTTREISENIDKAIEKVCKLKKGLFAQLGYIETEWRKFNDVFQRRSKHIRVVQYIYKTYIMEFDKLNLREEGITEVSEHYIMSEVVDDLVVWLKSRFKERRHNYLTEDEIFMNDIIYEVNSKRGAPMGRCDVGVRPNWKPVIVKRVPLVYDGVYDRGGAYWGSPDNLWVEFTMDLQYIHFYRKES